MATGGIENCAASGMIGSIVRSMPYAPIFDITADCEDGAATGNELPHAQMVARLITLSLSSSSKKGSTRSNRSLPKSSLALRGSSQGRLSTAITQTASFLKGRSS